MKKPPAHSNTLRYDAFASPEAAYADIKSRLDGGAHNVLLKFKGGVEATISGHYAHEHCWDLCLFKGKPSVPNVDICGGVGTDDDGIAKFAIVKTPEVLAGIAGLPPEAFKNVKSSAVSRA